MRGDVPVALFVFEATIPDQHASQEVARLMCTHEHAKKIAKLLNENLQAVASAIEEAKSKNDKEQS